MRLATAVLIAGCAFTLCEFATSSAKAVTTDDVKWINQCIADNKGDASDNVVLKYHVDERKACDREAGWK